MNYIFLPYREECCSNLWLISFEFISFAEYIQNKPVTYSFIKY